QNASSSRQVAPSVLGMKIRQRLLTFPSAAWFVTLAGTGVGDGSCATSNRTEFLPILAQKQTFTHDPSRSTQAERRYRPGRHPGAGRPLAPARYRNRGRSALALPARLRPVQRPEED